MLTCKSENTEVTRVLFARNIKFAVYITIQSLLVCLVFLRPDGKNIKRS